MVCGGGPLLIRAWMGQVAELRKKYGIEVVWVTSGAIASAADLIDFPRGKSRTLAEKQALSAMGQPIVMDLYNLALGMFGLKGAQILLTSDDLTHRDRRLNFQNTLEQLLSWGVVPVLNENDAVATQEIQFGDNDWLSALVAQSCGAERLVILTDVEGFYDSDPRKNPEAKLIHQLSSVSKKQLAAVEPVGGSHRGTGGMYSKLKAAQFAQQKGINTWLCKGDLPHVLLKVAEGSQVGTCIGEAKR